MALPPAPTPSFLGTGWAFPPEFSRKAGTCRMVSALDDIRESLWILLSTVPGERVMVPTYGCDLQRFVFQGLTTGLISQVRETVSTAIVRWEPRIDLISCLVSVDTDQPSLLLIEIAFQVRATNVRGNMVYPFYLSEATLRREA